MASVFSVASTIAGHVQHGETLRHHGEMLQAKAADLSQKRTALNAGTAPRNVTANTLARQTLSLDNANRNLSNAQFRHRIDVARTTSDVVSGAADNLSTGEGSQVPPSAIRTGLYS